MNLLPNKTNKKYIKLTKIRSINALLKAGVLSVLYIHG